MICITRARHRANAYRVLIPFSELTERTHERRLSQAVTEATLLLDRESTPPRPWVIDVNLFGSYVVVSFRPLTRTHVRNAPALRQ